MKTVIRTLKLQIAIAKEDIQHDENYIEQLRSRRPQARAENQEEALDSIIEERRETLAVRKELLKNLRHSLTFAIRALGYKATDIDTFEPEKFVID